ncbi:uridine 5'-monophosphate synthase-like [Styela clava]
MEMERSSVDLILQLFDIGAVKFGSFKLKSGITSPVYFDLRVIISYPDILIAVCEIMWKHIESNREKFRVICGVPYTALPIATVICTTNKFPMVIRRKEAKDYGTMKIIEGVFEQGSNCLIVEDVVTSGSSVWETTVSLQDAGLTVTDAIVLLNRQQGGREMLESRGITLHSIFTLTEVVTCLNKEKKISDSMVSEVKDFIANNNTFTPNPDMDVKPRRKSKEDATAKSYRNSIPDIEQVTYESRGVLCKNEVAARIFRIIHDKQTNLCLSADVDSAVELLEIADVCGPHICILKTHIDIIDHLTPNISKALTELSKKHNFIIFEDRKFADIGSTVRQQYSAGSYSISEWADLTNAHSLPGPGVIEGLKAAVQNRKDRACLLIAEMSSKGNLADANYTKATVQMAEDHRDFVIGFISTSKVTTDPTFLHMTPGVKLQPGDGQLGQQYLTPDEVICKRKCDIIIVGRGITLAANRLQAAIEYKNAGWKAYLDRVNA